MTAPRPDIYPAAADQAALRVAPRRTSDDQARTISIALIEDNRLVREGIAALLSETSDLAIVAATPSADTALLRETSPHVVLLDVGLWDDDSLHVAERLKSECPHSRVIIMDLLPAHEDLIDYLNAGVSGFILKDATFDELAATIRAVAAGAYVLPPQMTSTLFSEIARRAGVRSRGAALDSVRMTQREREVIVLIGEGLSNKEIAARLGIATHTVKSHVRNVMEKLALHSRLQIAAYAHRRDD